MIVAFLNVKRGSRHFPFVDHDDWNTEILLDIVRPFLPNKYMNLFLRPSTCWTMWRLKHCGMITRIPRTRGDEAFGNEF